MSHTAHHSHLVFKKLAHTVFRLHEIETVCTPVRSVAYGQLTRDYPFRGGEGDLRPVLSLWTLTVRHLGFVWSALSVPLCLAAFPALVVYVGSGRPSAARNEEGKYPHVHPHATNTGEREGLGRRMAGERSLG